MSEPIEHAIREQLREITSDEVTIRDITVWRDDLDRFGRPFTARERLRRIIERRLRGLRLFTSHDASLERELQSSLAALAAMTSEEQLYSWTAKAPGGYFTGTSTPLRKISITASDLDHNPIA